MQCQAPACLCAPGCGEMGQREVQCQHVSTGLLWTALGPFMVTMLREMLLSRLGQMQSCSCCTETWKVCLSVILSQFHPLDICLPSAHACFACIRIRYLFVSGQRDVIKTYLTIKISYYMKCCDSLEFSVPQKWVLPYFADYIDLERTAFNVLISDWGYF